MKTKKEIKSEIKTTRNGRNINHVYYTEDNRYDFETRLFESSSNLNRVVDGTGACVSGILDTKNDFVDFLYNELI